MKQYILFNFRTGLTDHNFPWFWFSLLAMRPAPFKSDNSLIEQIPILLGQGHCGRHDDVNGALGDVGHRWRGGKTEVEDGGVDREGFHAAGFGVSRNGGVG